MIGATECRNAIGSDEIHPMQAEKTGLREILLHRIGADAHGCKVSIDCEGAGSDAALRQGRREAAHRGRAVPAVWMQPSDGSVCPERFAGKGADCAAAGQRILSHQAAS